MNTTVTNTAAALTPNIDGTIIVQNLSGSVDVYVDTALPVTSSSGLKIPFGTTINLGSLDGGQLFAICASTADVRYLVTD